MKKLLKRNVKRKLVAIITLLCMVMATTFLIASRAPESSEIYVATNGNDHNPGTKVRPVQTIQKAVDMAKPGTNIKIRKGTYLENVHITKSGAKRRPIVIGPYRQEKVTVKSRDAKKENIFFIKNKHDIVIQQLTINNIWAKHKDQTPTAIRVDGNAKRIKILRNDISHLGTRFKEGNAHGIAFYGNGMSDIEVSHNHVHNLKLGNSETVVLNGDVQDFVIRHNKIHHNNNIGIDLIGYENVSKQGSKDFVRNGIIEQNDVYHNSSKHNPSYEGDQSAGGIYIDGAHSVVIRKNNTYKNDIGIEVASEHKNKYAQDITVEANTVYKNAYTGIAIGGYAADVGGVKRVKLLKNEMKENDTLNDQGGELLIQHHVYQLNVKQNVFETANKGYFIVKDNRSGRDFTMKQNTYKGRGNYYWVWNGKEIDQFGKYQKLTHETGHIEDTR